MTHITQTQPNKRGTRASACNFFYLDRLAKLVLTLNFIFYFKFIYKFTIKIFFKKKIPKIPLIMTHFAKDFSNFILLSDL